MTREWSAPESTKIEYIIAVATYAIISGADGWDDIETFGNAKRERIEAFLELLNGIPSRDTFERVFSLIDAQRSGRLARAGA